MKDFEMFCREHKIPATAPSIKYWKAGAVRTLKIEDDRDLTWEDVAVLTGGEVGNFEPGCPWCRSRAFNLERPTLHAARWHCFYCGRSGELRTGEPTDPVKEAEARKKAKARELVEKAEKTARAMELWDAGESIAGTPVLDYLAGRSIRDLPPNVHEVLRFHPACSFGRHGAHRAMLALFRDVRTDEPRAVHRTWIEPNGRAFLRMALGPIGCAAIKLWPLDGNSLVVGEGIETVLSAALSLTRANGEALRPAWALGVANNLKYFPVIKKIERLVILVDNDESGVGQTAAEMCSRRWCDAGREVLKLMPPMMGTDFNDVVKGMAR